MESVKVVTRMKVKESRRGSKKRWLDRLDMIAVDAWVGDIDNQNKWRSGTRVNSK